MFFSWWTCVQSYQSHCLKMQFIFFSFETTYWNCLGLCCSGMNPFHTANGLVFLATQINIFASNLQISSTTASQGFLEISVSNMRKLPDLLILDLSGNNFTGKIPALLGNCSKLNTILLNENGFSGSIPAQLFISREIVQIDLGFNLLTGIIPPWGRPRQQSWISWVEWQFLEWGDSYRITYSIKSEISLFKHEQSNEILAWFSILLFTCWFLDSWKFVF